MIHKVKPGLLCALTVILLSSCSQESNEDGGTPIQPTPEVNRITVRIFRTCIAGVDFAERMAESEEFIELISERVGASVDFDAWPKDDDPTYASLDEFGDLLNRGEIHLGWVSGLEFEWLRDKYPDLEAQLVSVYRFAPSFRLSFAVTTKFDEQELSELRGLRLAICNPGSVVIRLYVDQIAAEAGVAPSEFISETVAYPTNVDAVTAVAADKADCFVGIEPWVRAAAGNPASNLTVQGRPSIEIPEAVLICNPEQVPRSKVDKLVEQYRSGHTDPYYEDVWDRMTAAWRVHRYEDPQPAFNARVKSAVSEYSVEKYYSLLAEQQTSNK